MADQDVQNAQEPEDVSASSDSSVVDDGAVDQGRGEDIRTEAANNDKEELVREKIKQRKRAQAAEKKMAELEAELRKIREKDMSEKERAEAKAKELEMELAKERQERMHLTRVTIAQGHGVESDYTDYIASELKNASEAQGEDFDTEKWFEDLKKTKPAFFGSVKTSAPASGEGGATSGIGKKGTKDQQIADMEAEITALMKASAMGGRRSPQVENQLFNLRRKINLLKKGDEKFLLGQNAFVQPLDVANPNPGGNGVT